jgi:uncharacterized membrane protein
MVNGTIDRTTPTVTESYAAGWAVLKRFALELLAVGVVWALLGLPTGYLKESVFGLAYHVLVLGPVSFGGMYAFLRAARGERPEVNDLFAPFRSDYWQVVLANVLVGAIVSIGFVLLIVPGVIALVRLAWVAYLVVEERRPALEALRESWERTRGHGGAIFGIELLALPLVLVGLALLVVGVIPALIWVQLAMSCYYVAAVPVPRTAASEPGAPIG